MGRENAKRILGEIVNGLAEMFTHARSVAPDLIKGELERARGKAFRLWRKGKPLFIWLAVLVGGALFYPGIFAIAWGVGIIVHFAMTGLAFPPALVFCAWFAAVYATFMVLLMGILTGLYQKTQNSSLR